MNNVDFYGQDQKRNIRHSENTAQHGRLAMKKRFSIALTWLIRLTFLAALTYAASDLPKEQESRPRSTSRP